jgi:aminocarboxymuconate-semialdehyde decarboxylase
MAVNRRTFLHSAAAAGGFVFCGCPLLESVSAAPGAQAGAGRREVRIGGTRVRTIDMHSHAYVHEVWPLIQDRQEAGRGLRNMANGPMAMDVKSIESRLRDMDRQGIDVHAVSLHPGQYHYWAEAELARQIVRVQNERLAALCKAHPDRFVAIGGVSIQHPDLAAEQMEEGVRQLDMRGFMIGGSVNGEEISNPKLDPFWKKAETLGIVIFVHPEGFRQAGNRFSGAGYLNNTLGNPLETAVALSHMIFEGFLDRFPGLKILAAHGGGYLPSYIGRSDKCNSWNADCQKMKRKPSEYLRGPQLHFDSLVYSPQNIRHLVTTTGASQVVIGTDYWFDVASTTPVDDVLGTPGLTPADQIAILGGNAARLLKVATS